MSGEIFIETVEVTTLGLPVAEHLYLVWRGETGDEYVLRAGSQNDLWPFGKLEVVSNVALAISPDRRGNDSPEDRSSTPLDFGPVTDDQAWGLMVKYAARIAAKDIDYRLFEENSNAFVGALLHAAGGTPRDMLPTGLDPSQAIGLAHWTGIVQEVAPPKDWILRGTPGADRLVGLQSDDEIIGRGGRDVILGRAGDDMVRGGLGHDRVRGGDGDDQLRGNAGKDILRGGAGDDMLDGGNGSDTLVGGRGADVFVFRNIRPGERDTVVDFDRSVDRLELPDASYTIRATGEWFELVWDDYAIRFLRVEPLQSEMNTMDLA